MDSLSSDPASLLDELNRLHQLLSENQPQDVIPLLVQVVQEPEPLTTKLDPLLNNTSQQLIQEVIQDFMPQIRAELERRLQLHIEQLMQPVSQAAKDEPSKNSSRPTFDFLP